MADDYPLNRGFHKETDSKKTSSIRKINGSQKALTFVLMSLSACLYRHCLRGSQQTSVMRYIDDRCIISRRIIVHILAALRKGHFSS
ncbi:helix-turn-helix domain-containing protein [Enterobacter asburiae]|uniref:helix-turn-helix domain-containing protein n=1 Tax=Enterobacter asburiae TaxID=61645 RepID=UPI001072CD64